MTAAIRAIREAYEGLSWPARLGDVVGVSCLACGIYLAFVICLVLA